MDALLPTFPCPHWTCVYLCPWHLALSPPQAYRAACHYGDGTSGKQGPREAHESEKREDREDAAAAASFDIASSQVFNSVMLFVLREADGIFRAILEGDSQGSGDLQGSGEGGKRGKRGKKGGGWGKGGHQKGGKAWTARRGAEGGAEGGSLVATWEANSKWVKVEPLVKSYLGNSLHVLQQMTDPELQAFSLRCLRPSIPFLASFPKLARKFLKVCS